MNLAPERADNYINFAVLHLYLSVLTDYTVLHSHMRVLTNLKGAPVRANGTFAPERAE